MKRRHLIMLGAVLAALSVALGAFGAHGLKELLAETGRSGTFETAARYHFYHALAIIIVGILLNTYKNGFLKYAAWFFLLGIILFSGSLYAISINSNEPTWMMGVLAPVGGLSFITGWILLAFAVSKRK